MQGNSATMPECPICSTTSTVRLIGRQGSYDLLYCNECELRFSDPMEDPGSAFYEHFDQYGDRDDHAQISTGNPATDWRYATCMQLCSSGSPGRILDIGCGTGAFLSLARARGFDVYGLDIDQRAINYAADVRNMGHVMCGTWEDARANPDWRAFDVVTLFDVLEHVSSPLALLTEVNELLKPGGRVCVTVPHLNRRPRLFDVDADFPPHHFTLWTSRALTAALERAGFSHIEIMEKPVMLQDLAYHLVWRTKRVATKLRHGQTGPDEKGRHEANAPAESVARKTALGILKKSLRFVFSGPNMLMRAFKIGRGFSLMALAEKPAAEQPS